MAQTTAAISFKDCVISLSTDGTTFTDFSGHVTSLEISGGELEMSETFTGSTGTPIVLAGNKKPFDVTVKTVYTETSTEPFELARSAYASVTNLYVRWSPKGGASGTGENVYTTSAGYVTKPPFPAGDFSKGDALLFDAVVRCASITKTTSTT